MATTFAVIHTGDTNGVMENKDGAVGFAKVAGLADQTVEDYETLLLDSGNALTGDGGKNIKVMNAAGYTAAAIGTRDAALGVDRLQSLSAMADFPLLCANWLKMDGDLFFDPYAVIDVGNVRVGIIGLITPTISRNSIPISPKAAMSTSPPQSLTSIMMKCRRRAAITTSR